VGVASDIQAAGNIIDILDAIEDNPGVILVNVAPRNGKAKKWPNGTPFGFFWHKKILVLASVDGCTLSLVKKFELTKHITVLDIPNTLDQLIAGGALQNDVKDFITRTQFRSFDFLPRIATYLYHGGTVTGEDLPIETIPDAPPVVWWIDNFGNCKTTLVQEDMQKEKLRLSDKFKDVPYFERLKDVPDKSAALIVGSSGLGKKRFFEIVVQGGSAEEMFDVSAGETVLSQ
jgi:hypothetical protein